MKRNPVLSVLVAFSIVAILAAAGCSKNESVTSPPTAQPITDDLFPLVAGHQFVYTGYLVDTNSVETPVPGTQGHYSASWTLAPNPSDPSGSTWLILDSTTVFGLTSVHFFLIRKDTTTGDFAFLQTLGPFYRAIGVSSTDTAKWIQIAKPSAGAGVTWTAYDTSVTAVVPGIGSATVRLQIFGQIQSGVIVVDSSSAHNSYTTYLVRTWRKITANSFTIEDDATTAQIWLAKDIGPVQVDIAGDTENYGHFRVLAGKNF